MNEYILNASNLKEKLEMPFLQLPQNFAPKNMDRLEPFFKMLPKDINPAIEFRHTDWFNDKDIAEELYKILERHNIANAIVDNAGRIEKASPLLSAHFIEKANERFGTDLHIPKMITLIHYIR